MSLTIVTPPAEEPVTLTEAKNHLRVDLTDDDSLISALIVAAREHAEAITRRAFITQTLKLSLDAFPANNGPIYVPMPPLQSVNSLKYFDTDGMEQTLTEGTDFLVDNESEPGRITPAPDTGWPATQNRPNAVSVELVAGLCDASTAPKGLKLAILLMEGSLYTIRDAVALQGKNAGQLRMAVDCLLMMHRIWRFVCWKRDGCGIG